MTSGFVGVADVVVGFWSWARISRSGVERRSGWRGERGVGLSVSGSAVVVGGVVGTAERVRASQFARSALSLEDWVVSLGLLRDVEQRDAPL